MQIARQGKVPTLLFWVCCEWPTYTRNTYVDAPDTKWLMCGDLDKDSVLA